MFTVLFADLPVRRAIQVLELVQCPVESKENRAAFVQHVEEPGHFCKGTQENDRCLLTRKYLNSAKFCQWILLIFEYLALSYRTENCTVTLNKIWENFVSLGVLYGHIFS
jgi:hypothetical protein